MAPLMAEEEEEEAVATNRKKTRTKAKTNPLIDHQQLVLYS